jgi:hypothetical protein
VARPALLIALCLIAATPAEAAVPPGFWGTMIGGPLTEPDKTELLDSELRLMHRSGVRTLRMVFDWRRAEPVEGSFDFDEIDGFVGAATRHGLRPLPVVIWAPEWARRDPSQQASPPKPRAYAAFMTKLVQRYGPNGAFWRGRRARPIREWQIWNEPTVPNFWTIQPFERDYVELLRKARRSVRRVDRGARIVTAGLVYESWKALDKLYDAGVRGLFEVLALHPFTERPRDTLRIVELNRRVMRRHGDTPRPIFLTEYSWPSSRDKIGERYGYETDERGQAARIRQAFPMVAEVRRRLRIERLYWYTWLTRETDPEYPFDYAGLRRFENEKDVASKPAFRAFRETVASLLR